MPSREEKCKQETWRLYLSASGNKSFICVCLDRLLAAFCAAGVPVLAAAQSELSVYGYLDLGIAKESGSPARLDRGYNNWLGIRGKEQLGNGLTALFNLETRFKPDTGETERPLKALQGESTVGLTSALLGTLRFGRALTPLWHTIWMYEPWANSGFNASLAAYQTGRYSSDGIRDEELDYADFSRVSDAIFYSTPTLSGLTVHASAKIDRDVRDRRRVAGLSIDYTRSGFSGMLAYEKNANSDTIRLLGASYKFGRLTLMGSYARNRRWQETRERTYVVAATYAFGANTLRTGYGSNRENGNHKMSVGYIRHLSKRTGLYADLYRERIEGSSNGAAVGITHSF